MTTAAELIHYLQRRAQLKAHRMPPPGEFPAGWKQWFAAMKLQPGHVTGAAPEEIVGELARRAPAAPVARVMTDLTRWQAFSTLWRQEWQSAAEPADRRIHVAASTISVLCHVFFAAMLVWLMYLQYLVATPPPLGEHVVQVEYIGTGTPEEAGGGEAAPAAPSPAPGAPARAPATSAQPARSAAPLPAPSVAVEAPRLDAPLPDVPQREVPAPVVPPAAAEQVVTVSEPTPSTEPDAFFLPPPQPRIAEVPITAPELRVPARELQVAEVPAPVQPIRPELPQPAIAAPLIESRTPAVATRDVPAPLPQVPTREIAVPAIEQPELAAALPVRERAIPTPSRAPAADPATATSPAANGGATPSSTAGTPSSPLAAPGTSAPGQADSGPAATTAGVGPNPVPSPGGWPSPRRSDDWGDSTRNVPGGQRGDPAGLFDSDGSVRLAETPGSASPGRPPGTVTDEIVNLDRAGTWLKRKPIDYEPTAFDRFWLPHETLLAEWVRKGVKEVAIPIPGTNRNIVCVVSLLQLGGGCGVNNPNLNEQPAAARPPPDVPFKPHLQEDNGSVRP